jgi:hypothetical protein
MSPAFVAGVAVATATGAALGWFFSGRVPSPARDAIAISTAFPLGLGISGVTFFLWRLAGGRSLGTLVLVDLLCLGVATAAATLGNRSGPRSTGPPGAAAGTRRVSWHSIAPLVALALAVLLAGVAVHAKLTRMPSGEWDAWAIWSMRARFLAFGGDRWLAGFDPEVVLPDYPALLPSAIARLWTYAPTSDAGAPQFIALAFTICIPLLAAALLLSGGGAFVAAACGLALCGTPALLRSGASQYADVEVAAYLLLGIGALHLATTVNVPRLAALGGLSLGLCAWTKNEGSAMLVVTIVAFAVREVSARGRSDASRYIVACCAGAMLGVAALVPFKLAIAQRSFFFQDTATHAARFLDATRHHVIGAALLKGAVQLGSGGLFVALAVVALAFGLRRASDPRPAWAVLGLGGIAAVEWVAYLVTPFPLEWHLATSADRLVLQLWPAALLVAFSFVHRPDHSRAQVEAAAVRPARRHEEVVDESTAR